MAAGLWELKGKQAERQTLLSRDDITTKAIKKLQHQVFRGKMKHHLRVVTGSHDRDIWQVPPSRSSQFRRKEP